MTSATIRGILIGLALLLLGAAVLHRAGLAPDAMPRLPGHGPWFLARATGITAFVALSLDVILGLAMTTRAAERWLPRGHAVDLHRWLSPVALALVAGHALVLLADGFARFDVIDVLVPFAHPYRSVAVGLGIIAAYLAVVVHASFALRKRLGTRTWRRLHAASFATFAAAAGHALLAGTDAARPWARAAVLVPVAVVLVLVIYRVVRARRP